MAKHTARPRPASTVIVPFPDRFSTTVRLPNGQVVDQEFEGDPPPGAPLGGRRITFVEIPN